MFNLEQMYIKLLNLDNNQLTTLQWTNTTSVISRWGTFSHFHL